MCLVAVAAAEAVDAECMESVVLPDRRTVATSMPVVGSAVR